MNFRVRLELFKSCRLVLITRTRKLKQLKNYNKLLNYNIGFSVNWLFFFKLLENDKKMQNKI